MIKTKLLNIVQAQPFLSKLYSSTGKIDTKSKLRRMFNVINAIFQDIETKRNELIGKYGKDGKIDQTNKEGFDSFLKEWDSLLQEDIELDIDPERKIKEEWITIDISNQELDSISFLLEESK